MRLVEKTSHELASVLHKGLGAVDWTEADPEDLAIAIEEEAKERYEEFAEQLEAHHSPEVAAGVEQFLSVSLPESSLRLDYEALRARHGTCCFVAGVGAPPEFDEVEVDIGVQELLWKARTVGSQNFKMLETLILAALVYWILTIIFSYFQERMEQRMARGDR